MNKFGKSLAVFNWASQKAEKDLVNTITKEKLQDCYEIREEIGRGAFGTVKKCEKKKDKTVFAIKVILYKDPKLLKDIEREVSMMRRLEHEHLVTLYESYESAGSFALVMDYIAGGELFERIVEKEYLEEQEAVEYLRQLIQGLQHMHSRNIVHLDIKPENILCVDNVSNRIKLIDFGLARELKPGEITRCALGTPDFIAPEALSFNEIKPETDMWSTGVLTYVLLSGLMPFGGENDHETLCNISNVDWEFDEDSFEEISSNARDFIEKLLTLNPDDRLSSTDAIQHPWMRESERGGKINTKRHRTFLARRRWKKSVHVIMAVTKLCRMLQLSTSGKSESGVNSPIDKSSSPSGSGNCNFIPKPKNALDHQPETDANLNPKPSEMTSCNLQESFTKMNSLANDSDGTRTEGKTVSFTEAVVNDSSEENEDESAEVAVKSPAVTKTLNKGQNDTRTADSKLVRNVAFATSNGGGEKKMWKILK
ncbi:myosin light chain kinase family member 4-like [Dendronephthya gigantea]|uniref:myosin light chain kinase family member 4-like n=1 Tax=Dendronephthya gigantea TaxID=151771 RepID=UPI0010693C15|nr:myosin light chain kinase family member 4-like [Dendronephthya gigantea]